MSTPVIQAALDIRTPNDKEIPRIIGLTTAHGHFCVVSDLTNKSVKVVDTRSQRVTSEISIKPKVVRGLTSVNDGLVAVSLLLPDFKIQFFSVSTSGVIKSTPKKFNVKGICPNLGHCNEKLFLCHGDEIITCNITGKVIKTIKHDSAGVPIFAIPFGISLSPDGETIYVADQSKNSVISLTLDGSVNAIFRNKDLKNPHGITVDKQGYVYVCSRNCSQRFRVYKLTPDLSSGQIIIKDVGWNVITVSSDGNTLYVSDCKRGYNEYHWISVYDLNTH